MKNREEYNNLRILIDNCVPTNNGDAALIFSLYENLKAENIVSFSTLKYSKVKKMYPNLTWYKSNLEKLINQLMLKMPKGKKIWKQWMSFYLRYIPNEYKNSNLIISAPGGYIHSYYGIEERLFILWYCKKILNKKVGIYSQSIGNLNKEDQQILLKYGKELNFIYARDQASYNRLLEYGLLNNAFLTYDAAFMLQPINKRNIQKKSKKVAISVRSWEKEGYSTATYLEMLYKIVLYLKNRGYTITFLSTCQGLKNYVDDSRTAKIFCEKYGFSQDSDIIIDENFYTLEELQNELQNFDFVIGTRLHMCILSLINGVFALNISYEEKGKEVYNYLGLNDFTLDYNYTGNVDTVLLSICDLSQEELEEKIRKVDIIRTKQLESITKMYSLIDYESESED